MKRRTITIATISLFLCAFASVSCEKDINAVVDEDNFPSMGFSDADYFAGQFVSLDEEGNVALHLSGYLLNEADDTEISYCTEEWQEAVSMFKGWLPEEAVYQETESSLTWEMHDAEGKFLGEAVLSKKNGDLVAEAILPASTPYVRTIRFIPKAAWPENRVMIPSFDDVDNDDLLDDYFFGNTVEIKTAPKDHDHGTGEFIVLREYNHESNEKGILFRLVPGLWSLERADKDRSIYKRRRNMSDAKLVSRIYRQNSKALETVIERMESFGPRTAWYYAYEPRAKFPEPKDQKIQMHTGSLHWWNAFYPNANELYIYYFWVEENSSGSLVFKME